MDPPAIKFSSLRLGKGTSLYLGDFLEGVGTTRGETGQCLSGEGQKPRGPAERLSWRANDDGRNCRDRRGGGGGGGVGFGGKGLRVRSGAENTTHGGSLGARRREEGYERGSRRGSREKEGGVE